MKKFYHKLVRDKIPEIIKANGDIPEISHYIDNSSFETALLNKFIEEVEELRIAKDEKEILSELADILEVFDTLVKLYDVCQSTVEKYQIEKKHRCGEFDKRIKLISTQSNPPCICDKKDYRIIQIYDTDSAKWVEIPFNQLTPGKAFIIYDGIERYINPKDGCNVWIATGMPFINNDGIWAIMTSY